MCSRRLLAAAFGAAILAASATASMQGLPTSKRTTYLTFNRAVALPGVELAAGTYIFELASPDQWNLVRVLSGDRSRIHLTAFTNVVRRPRGLRPDQMVTLGEAPRGMAAPIKVWYPPEDTSGREFIYR